MWKTSFELGREVNVDNTLCGSTAGHDIQQAFALLAGRGIHEAAAVLHGSTVALKISTVAASASDDSRKL